MHYNPTHIGHSRHLKPQIIKLNMIKTFESVYYDSRNMYKKEDEKADKKKQNEKKSSKEKNYNFASSEIFARGPEGYQMVQFFSRSKDKDAKYLSTMQTCELVIDGKVYMSMEHYYQSQKYPADKRHLFEKNGKFASPKEAKSASSKSGMKKNNVKLNLTAWNGMSQDYPNEFHRIRVMKKAIWARFKQDKRFRDILCRPKTYFVHYDKKRGKFNPKRIPSWGCYKSKDNGWCGLNILGLLYIEIARFHSIDNWLEKNGKLNWSIKVWQRDNPPFKPWEKSHPLIPHRALTPRKEWKYGGFEVKEEYNTFTDSSIILHC